MITNIDSINCKDNSSIISKIACNLNKSININKLTISNGLIQHKLNYSNKPIQQNKKFYNKKSSLIKLKTSYLPNVTKFNQFSSFNTNYSLTLQTSKIVIVNREEKKKKELKSNVNNDINSKFKEKSSQIHEFYKTNCKLSSSLYNQHTNTTLISTCYDTIKSISSKGYEKKYYINFNLNKNKNLSTDIEKQPNYIMLRKHHLSFDNSKQSIQPITKKTLFSNIIK